MFSLDSAGSSAITPHPQVRVPVLHWAVQLRDMCQFGTMDPQNARSPEDSEAPGCMAPIQARLVPSGPLVQGQRGPPPLSVTGLAP